MSETDFLVPPKSWARVDQHALDLREVLRIENIPYADVVNILDRVLDTQLGLLEMIVEEDSKMDGALAYTSPDGSFIKLSNTTYELACKSDHRARFTIAHEIGHWMMHTDQGYAFPRLNNPREVPAYKRAEPQANRFAASFLIPDYLIPPNATAMDIMMMFGVSAQTALIRLSER